MIHVRIDRHHPSSVDIYVNIAERTSSPDSHVYDRLFDQQSSSTYRQSSIVKTRSDSNPSLNRKHYTLEQVLDNVQSIQQQYEKVIKHRKANSTVTCRSTFKHLAKLVKNFRTIKPMEIDESTSLTNDSKSPFIFGGETLQWIALPREESDHIYENDFFS